MRHHTDLNNQDLPTGTEMSQASTEEHVHLVDNNKNMIH